MSNYRYHVGGSLSTQAPSYIERAADKSLYTALQAGEFCYVLNSRQMGKSSLMVRASHQLQSEGVRCAVLDMTRIGSENISPGQWYKGIATELWDGFDLAGKVNLKDWWKALETLSMSQRLGQFIDSLLLTHFPDEKIVIFVDEIDSTLSLGFSVDDFFAMIRSYYNQRAHRPDYHRLTFVLLGVATPSDLVQDRHKTPFNIGQAINLQGFQSQEAQALAQGFAGWVKRPQAVLGAILDWTGGQPFLTQKLCALVQAAQREKTDGSLMMEPGNEAGSVAQLVRSQLIKDWETQDEPEHLRTIRDRIERNGHRTGRMLAVYQQTLLGDVIADSSREQTELLLSGLVVKQQGVLTVKNKVYAEVFNPDWVRKKLEILRPYSQAFDAWVASKQQDESRLLRGQALQDAASWARGKSLSDEDYQFLASSEALDRQQVQQALEVEWAEEIVARQSEEEKNTLLKNILIGGMGLALVGLVGFITVIWQQNRTLAWREVEAIATTSDALLSADKDLESMVAAIKAARQLQEIGLSENNLKTVSSTLSRSTPDDTLANDTLADPLRRRIAQQVNSALRRAVFKTSQYNAFAGHSGTIRTLAFSPDGSAIASASVDNTAKLWQPDGTLITTLTGHAAPLVVVEFSADGQQVMTTSEDNTAKLWQIDGTLITTLVGHTGPIWAAEFSPDGQTILTGSGDKTLKLWRPDGTLITTFAPQPSAIFEAEFSPDGQAIATANASNTVEIWQLDGTLVHSLGTQDSRVSALEFSAAGGYLATASEKGTVKLWDSNTHKLMNTIAAHAGAISGLHVSPDGQQLVTSSSDKTVKLWQQDGTLIKTYAGHEGQVYDVRFSPDGKTLASAGVDTLIRLWRVDHPLVTALNGHRSRVVDAQFSPDGQLIATSSVDSTVKLWRRNGQLLQTIREHSTAVNKSIFSPNGNRLMTASEDGIISVWQLNPDSTLNLNLIATWQGNKGGLRGATFSPEGDLLAISSIDGSVQLWKTNGTLVRTLKGHTAPVWSVVFSPNGEQLATVSSDNQAKIWQRDGSELITLTGSGAPFFGVDFSPDGKTLATTSSDTTVTLWHLDSLTNDSLTNDSLTNDSLTNNNTKSEPEGETTERETIRSTQLTGHTSSVFDVDYSPDGQLLATVSGDNALRLWGADGSTQAIFEKHNASIEHVAFSPDGQLIVTASDDKTALLWDLEQILQLDLLTYSCDWVGDYLRTNNELEDEVRSLCSE